jgi:uncharacterized membrane protein
MKERNIYVTNRPLAIQQLVAEVARLREALKEITQEYDPSHHGEIAEDMNAIALAALAHKETDQ